jgi:hypothetical protein
MRLVDLTFDDWIEHAFGHEVRIQRNPWFFDTDHDWWAPRPAVAVDYLARLFERPDEHLRWFSDAQIAQGLTYLVSTSASGDSGWLYSTDVATANRLACIHATYSVFEKLFAPRCLPSLGHLSEIGGPLNGVCYMWWDEFPSVALAGDPDRAGLHEALLNALRRILKLPSLACQESALHGLGHWAYYYPTDVAPIIDAWLANGEIPEPRLILYAQSAPCGCVL